jgi:hypothetical protein
MAVKTFTARQIIKRLTGKENRETLMKRDAYIAPERDKRGRIRFIIGTFSEAPRDR